MNKLLPLIVVSLCLASVVSMGQKANRLAASSIYNYDGTTAFILTDSTHYAYYSPTRGGDLNSAYIPYDVALSYFYSTTSPTTSKQSIQKFDSYNHRVAQTNYKSDIIYTWVENDNTLYTPNLSDSILNETNQLWNKIKSGWDNRYQQVSSFDAANNKTSLTTYNWDSSSNAWLAYDRLIYEYGAANLLVKKTYQTWASTSSSWDNVFIDSFNYSTTNKTVLYTNFLWNKTRGDWEKHKHTIYRYDSSDFLVQQTESGWDTVSNSWRYAQQFTFLNDSKGNIQEMPVQNWNIPSSSWINFRKKVYFRDSRANILNDRWLNWDSIADSFVNGEQTTYTFDLSNNMLSEVSSGWTVSTGSWDSIERDRYAYNTNNQLVFHTHDMWNKAGYWNYVLYDPKFYYYYEEYTTDVATTTLPKGNLLLYPIPANKNMNMSLKWDYPQSFRVRITDIKGCIREEWSVPATSNYMQNINLSALSSGNYFIECIGSNNGYIQQRFSVID